MSLNSNSIQRLVQLKRRTSSNTWDTEWTDITPWFLARTSDVNIQLDDQTLQGRIEQASVQLRMNNMTGKFNPAGTEGSLWNGTSEFMYHSRIRYYEWSNKDQVNDGDEPDFLPLIDGLLAEEPKYYINNDCMITVNSMLDILRDHCILEGITGRTYSFSSVSIITYINKLFDVDYQQLGVTTTGGFFRNEILYDSIQSANRTLYNLMETVISDGGGVGGLTNDKTLFFTYPGALSYIKTNFVDDSDTIGGWTCTNADYLSGTSIQDISANNYDLTTYYSSLGYGYNWNNGLLDTACSKFYRVLTTEWPNLESYSLELVLQIYRNRLPHSKSQMVVMGQEDYLLNPIFVWSTDSTADHYMPHRAVSASFEGFFINEQNELQYVVGHTALVGVHYVYVIDSTVVVGVLLAEMLFQYICINVDYTNKNITFFMQGKQQDTVVDTGTSASSNIGSVSYSSKNKILGSGAGYLEPSGGQTWELSSLGVVYYSGIKLSDVLKTPAQVLDQYCKLFGSGYSI